MSNEQVSGINQSYLKEMLEYNQDTGVLSWKVSPARRVKVGDAVGYITNEGYIGITIKSKTYRAHRIIWMYVYGGFPQKQIDHINGDRSDNRLCNLRLATSSDNAKNRKITSKNTSGFKGVSFRKANKKWYAQCQANGIIHHLGYFDTAETASDAYQQFAASLHGEFYSPFISKEST